MSHFPIARCGLALCLFATLCVAQDRSEPAKENQGLPLLFHEDFKSGDAALKKFTFTDAAAWKVAEDDVNGAKQPVLSLFRQSKYKPPVRCPVNQAWINGLKASDFVLEVKVRSTIKDYPHRDMCLFFAGVDDSHLFYVHLGKRADPHANNIFLVDAKDRVAVATKTSPGTPWDEKYHVAKVTRDEKGINVYWDRELVMTADSEALPVGKVGVGSFDDVGNFASVTVWGKKGE